MTEQAKMTADQIVRGTFVEGLVKQLRTNPSREELAQQIGISVPGVIKLLGDMREAMDDQELLRCDICGVVLVLISVYLEGMASGYDDQTMCDSMAEALALMVAEPVGAAH